MNYTPELTVAALKMVLSLAFVLAIVWGLYRLTRRRLPIGQAGGHGTLIRVLGSHYLGLKKSIAVVQVPGSILVLGIGAEQVNLLSRIEDPELLRAFQAENPSTKVLSFKDQLHRMMRPMRRREPSVGNEIKAE